jgi:hypothetical protein
VAVAVLLLLALTEQRLKPVMEALAQHRQLAAAA